MNRHKFLISCLAVAAVAAQPGCTTTPKKDTTTAKVTRCTVSKVIIEAHKKPDITAARSGAVSGGLVGSSIGSGAAANAAGAVGGLIIGGFVGYAQENNRAKRSLKKTIQVRPEGSDKTYQIEVPVAEHEEIKTGQTIWLAMNKNGMPLHIVDLN